MTVVVQVHLQKFLNRLVVTSTLSPSFLVKLVVIPEREFPEEVDMALSVRKGAYLEKCHSNFGHSDLAENACRLTGERIHTSRFLF